MLPSMPNTFPGIRNWLQTSRNRSNGLPPLSRPRDLDVVSKRLAVDIGFMQGALKQAYQQLIKALQWGFGPEVGLPARAGPRRRITTSPPTFAGFISYIQSTPKSHNCDPLLLDRYISPNPLPRSWYSLLYLLVYAAKAHESFVSTKIKQSWETQRQLRSTF